MAKKKHIYAINARNMIISCEASCPRCKIWNKSLHANTDIDYSGCYYESDRPDSVLTFTFECRGCNEKYTYEQVIYKYEKY